MIPVYICDDELPIRKNLEQIVSNQILILDSDMGLFIFWTLIFQVK